MLRVRLKGDEQLLRALERASEDLQEELASGLHDEGQTIQKESQQKTPVETGKLRDSAYTTEPEKDEDTGAIRVEVGYTAEYAVYVHERTDLHHNTGQAKFLEQAFKEQAPKVFRRLAKRLRRAL